MGKEAACTVEFNGKRSDGRALLETDELIFRGEFRLKMHRREISSLRVEDGKLYASSPSGEAVFHLGAAASRWEAAFLNPPSRLKKLGVKSGTRYRIVGCMDAQFLKDLAEAQAVPDDGLDAEITFLAAAKKDDLASLLPPSSGCIWVIYPKSVQIITEADVLAAGRAIGLTDIKVVSFSPTHTALKFVPRRDTQAHRIPKIS